MSRRLPARGRSARRRRRSRPTPSPRSRSRSRPTARCASSASSPTRSSGVALERSAGVGEVRVVGGARADDERLARRRPPRGLRPPGHRGARRASPRRTRTCPAATSPRPSASSRCARWAACPTPRGFSELVVATIDGIPIRVSDLGRAEDGDGGAPHVGAARRRADRRPRGDPPVRREHGRRDRRREGGARPRAARAAARRPAPRDPRPVALHPRRAPRDQRPPGRSARSSRASSCSLFMRSWRAHADRLRRDPDVGHRDVRRDVVARLHAQQRDDARARADGRHRDRRRDRRAREHRSASSRRSGMPPKEAARRGHRRDRARRARDDAQPRRDLRPGLVHVEHRGAVPLPVRHHAPPSRSSSASSSRSR